MKELQSPNNEVYYATPEIYTNTDLGNFYSLGNIVQNSGLFSIDSLPNYMSGNHQLIYSPSHNWGQLFSEPTIIKKINSLNPTELFHNSEKELTIYKQAERLSHILRKQENILSNIFEFNTNNQNQLVKEVYTALLTIYNVHWYPVLL